MDDTGVSLYKSAGDDQVDLCRNTDHGTVGFNISLYNDWGRFDDAVDLDTSVDGKVVDFNSIELDKSGPHGTTDFNKLLDDEQVHMDLSESENFVAGDDGVELDKSMDDEAVDLNESMDYDFAKVTGARKFSYNALVEATDNFSEQYKLGEGGFGAVYKGFLNELNCSVAVKRVSRDSKQGIKEYAYEVKIISELRHRNIVKLMGWCHEKMELLLVYEFMSNGSLDSHLFKENSLLMWEMRYKIAQGLASGVLYLHEEWEQYVVHRDIKASNVMLDSDFNPKIGDFGLARLAAHGNGLAYTALGGTIGYVSPEYATTGRATKESDVYSFGIVLLEIACGRKIIDRKAREDQINLREWVWDLYGEGRLLEAVDPRLNGEFDKQQGECLMIVGLWCAHPDEKSRPIMEKAIHALKFIAPIPDLPSKMPMVSYFAPLSFSSGSSVTISEQSQNKSPKDGNTDMVHKTNYSPEQEKLGKGNFAVIYKGILNVKNSRLGLWNRNKVKKEVTEFQTWTVLLRKFSYKELVHATYNFSENNILEVGDSVTVYKGFLMDSNMYISVKRASKASDRRMKEYASEVMIISQMRHWNLVELIGWCHNRKELCLVFEFMPNGSLEYNLFTSQDSLLTWELRYKIAQGLASGLSYLHEGVDECVVHGDIKSSNIVLDSNFNAKLGGFELARLMGSYTRIQLDELVGTSGYHPSEVSLTGKVSKESDVYSFGIVALEIASGRRSQDQGSYKYGLVHWVWDMYKEDKLLEAADPKLDGDFDERQIKCLMIVGLWCAHPNPYYRPSVRQAIKVLNLEASLPLLPRQRPNFIWPPVRPILSRISSNSDISDSITETTMWFDSY